MFGWGYGHGFLSIVGGVFFVVIWLLCLAVLVGILFLLVRFLLAGTRAAQIYIAKNEPVQPVTADAAAADASAAASSAQSARTKAAPKSAAKAPAKPATSPKAPALPKSSATKSAPKSKSAPKRP